MTIHQLQVNTPAPPELWQTLYASDADAVVSQSVPWMQCNCQVTGALDASRYYDFGNGREAVLPLIRSHSTFNMLGSLHSPPHGWGFGGLLTNCKLQPQDINRIYRDLVQQPFMSLSIRPNPLKGPLWASGSNPKILAISRRAHVIDLDGGFSQVWSKRYEKTTRTAVRKAERAQLSIECDTSERSVKAFQSLYLMSLDRWSEQQHEPRVLTRWRGLNREPTRKLQTIASKMGSNCRIYIAWLDGQPIAGTLLLIGHNAHATRSVMNKDLAGPTCAGDLLYNLAIKDACDAGCRYFHMGESGTSISLARFKKGFGALGYDYAEFRIERMPITRLDAMVRRIVKNLIGFRDTTNEDHNAKK